MKNEELTTYYENFSLNDNEASDYILQLFDSYKEKREIQGLYYSKNYVAHNIIGLYYYYINKNDYHIVYRDFKDLYIFNESRVEDNCSTEEQLGIGKIYDYIQDYDFSQKDINIFMDAMKIHQLLYSFCKGKEFGGSLRTGTALLYNSDVEVVMAKEAISFFNSYILNSPKILEKLDESNIFDYIEQCIRITTDLIKLQPFSDGNKRTFRALLNLFFKRKNIPPIYVKLNEKDLYKQFLFEAFKGNYDNLICFYYYQICDSIVELDIKNKIVKK